MKSSKNIRLDKAVTLKIILFILFSDMLETATEFCFKKSALTVSGNFSASIAASPLLWVGILLVGLSFAVWSLILSRIDLSVALPIGSFSYIFVTAVSIIFLHENVTPLRWLGVFFILAGILFVSVSSREKESL